MKTIPCPVTGKDLYRVNTDNGRTTILHSFGICEECKLAVAEEGLWFPDGTEPSRWAIQYLNVNCKDCHGTASASDQPIVPIVLPGNGQKRSNK